MRMFHSRQQPSLPAVLLVVTLALGCAAPGRATELAGAHRTVGASVWSTAREPAIRPPAPARAGKPRLDERVQTPRWTFQLGGTVAARPTVGRDGTVYVATTEGNLVALGPAGQFRWSYSVGAPVLGAVELGVRGVVYVATTEGHVYALLESGKKLWGFRASGPVHGGVAVGHDGLLYFVGGDEHLYALSARGGALWRVPIGGAWAAGPQLSAGGTLVVATRSRWLVQVGALLRKRRTELDEAVTQLLAAPDGSIYVVGTESLFAVAPDGGLLWRAAGVAAVTLAEPPPASAAAERAAARRPGGVRAVVPEGPRLVVVRHDGRLVWRRTDGAVERSVALGVGPSGPPAADRSGGVYVPAENGQLVVVCGDRVWRVPVATVALGEPQVDPDRGQVLVSSGSGLVAAVATCGQRRQ